MIEILKRNKRIEIEKVLKEKFGINIPFKYHLIKTGKGKLRIFTGHLPPHDLIILDKLLNIETLGLYFAFFKNKELRLSFDSAVLFGKNAKNIIELNESETKKWLQGHDIEKKSNIIDYIIVKHNSDVLGCGKATEKKILNFVPKERRIL